MNSSLVLLTYFILNIMTDTKNAWNLYLVKSMFDPNNRVTIWKEGQFLFSDLKTLQGSDKICTFFLNEDDYIIGFLIDITDDQVLIRGIGDEGDDDGISCYYIDNFIGLRYDSLVEQKIKLLYDNQAEFYE